MRRHAARPWPPWATRPAGPNAPCSIRSCASTWRRFSRPPPAPIPAASPRSSSRSSAASWTVACGPGASHVFSATAVTPRRSSRFSCKRRGFCPSCGGRRMAAGAAELVDHILPHVPMRQWVLSLPHCAPLSPRLGSRPLPRRAHDLHPRAPRLRAAPRAATGITDGRSGTVTAIQRILGAGSNSNIHFHTLVLEGVFVPAPDGTPPASIPPRANGSRRGPPARDDPHPHPASLATTRRARHRGRGRHRGRSAHREPRSRGRAGGRNDARPQRRRRRSPRAWPPSSTTRSRAASAPIAKRSPATLGMSGRTLGAAAGGRGRAVQRRRRRGAATARRTTDRRPAPRRRRDRRPSGLRRSARLRQSVPPLVRRQPIGLSGAAFRRVMR